MELKEENYGISKFLFYKVPSLEEVERAELEVLKNSRIPGLLPCAVLQQEEEVLIRYDLVSDTSLEMLFTKPVSKETLCKSLNSIAETLIEAQNCGLNIENFVFSSHHIFIDNFSSRLVFIYLPVKNNIFEKVSLKEFLKEILTMAPFDENDDSQFFIKLHNYLLISDDISPEGVVEKLQGWEDDAETLAQAESGTPFSESTEMTSMSSMADPLVAINSNFYSPGSPRNEVKTTVDRGVVTSEYSSQKKEKKTSQKLEIEEEVQYKRITRTELGDQNPFIKGAASIGGTSINIQPNFGNAFAQQTEPEGTTVLGADRIEEDEGTTTLGVGVQAVRKPFLLSAMQKEKIIIAKDVFKIGRDPQQSDYTSKNKVVGRVHALFITVNGEYYFEDNHSTNGSFVNGVKAFPNDRVKIKHDDVIKLANEEYIFRIF